MPDESPASTERQQEVFFGALEIDDPACRSAYLDAECAGDPQLRAWVSRELKRQTGQGGATSVVDFQMPRANHGMSMADAEATAAALRPESAGERIGSYKLIEQIGEGGFGAVWLAEQEQPVQRRVALKIIKVGMNTREVIARFEQERQALAIMNHSSIAKVFDAGATPFGRPFFVMELVTGVPVTEFCDDARLSVHERLVLFAQVCQAIQHAHQKGVIHRDVKPTNVLVALHDGVPVPKVIDFGLAKAMQKRLTAETLYTQAEQMIGTPLYMSPEQAEMSWTDIDTRTDIYSLGVLLYEMLTGRTPIDWAEVEHRGYDEIRRMIREEEPPRPSVALRMMERNALQNVARHRGLEPPKLIQTVRGDLDWIVMKALEKDRARRYATANDFSTDIQRFLGSKPVLARPPSAFYVLRRFARRHKGAFAAGIAVAAALVFGLATATWQFVQKNKAYQAARIAQAAEVELRERAETGELAARRKAYAADMNLVEQALASNNLGRARSLLDAQRPLAGRLDLRGWEWRYLWQRCQSDALYVFCRQSSSIFSLAVSQDGKQMAIGEAEGGLSIWDVKARSEVARMPASDGAMLTAFSPTAPLLAYAAMEIPVSDNDRQIAAKRPHTVRFWSATGAPAGEVPLADWCRGLAFSADGQTLLAATSGELLLWNVAEGRKVASFGVKGMARSRAAVRASRDLSVAAYAMAGGKLRAVDLATGRERWTVRAAEENVMSLAFSADGKILASGAGYVESVIRLWDVAKGAKLDRLDGHRTWISALAFWPKEPLLASTSGDQTIRLWDIQDLRLTTDSSESADDAREQSSRLVSTLRGHKLEVWSLALAPDGKTLFSGSKDGSVYAWDTTRRPEDRSHLSLPGPVEEWRFAPDGKSILIVDDRGRVSSRKAPDFDKKDTLFEVGRNVFETLFSNDARYLATVNFSGVVQVWDTKEETLLRDLGTRIGSSYPLAFLPGSTRLLTADIEDNSIHEWDVTTGEETRSWFAERSLDQRFAVAVSPDAQWFLLIFEDGTGSLLNRISNITTQLALPLKEVSQACFSPDGKTFAVVTRIGVAGLWQTEGVRPVTTLEGFLQGMHAVTFSPDGKRLAIGGDGREAVKIWDTERFQELSTLAGQGSVFRDIAFSSDGNMLAASNEGGALHVWRTPTLREIAKVEKRSPNP